MNEDKKTLELAAAILEKINRGWTPAEALEEFSHDCTPEEITAATAAALQFSAEHVHSFKWYNGLI